MKMTIESTPMLIPIDEGGHVRVWNGTTESGVPVHVLVYAVGVDETHPRVSEFQAELLDVESHVELISAVRWPSDANRG